MLIALSFRFTHFGLVCGRILAGMKRSIMCGVVVLGFSITAFSISSTCAISIVVAIGIAIVTSGG